MLDYIAVKLEAGLAPATIQNGLSIVRRVLNLAVRDDLIAKNPASGIGKLTQRVDRRVASEVRSINAWSRDEVETLLSLAAEYEPQFEPLLRFLMSTGARRGEALGLRWDDIDFERRRITIRRALKKVITVTPKSGRARVLAMPPTLALSLFNLLTQRQREAIHRGWASVPEPVFCSEAAHRSMDATSRDLGIADHAGHRSRVFGHYGFTMRLTRSRPSRYLPGDPSAGLRINSVTPTPN